MIPPQSSAAHHALLHRQYHPYIALRGQTLYRLKQKVIISTLSTVEVFSKKRTHYRCLAVNPSASSSDTTTSTQNSDRIQVEISTRDAQTAIKFSAVRVGGGKAVVVEAVAIGSEAEEAGILSGQQLFLLSDPIRPAETWSLNDRSSLRYIKDAVRMRRAPYIMLELSAAPLKEWIEEKEASLFPSALNVYSSTRDNDEVATETDLLTAVAAEALSTSSSLDSIDLPSSSSTVAASGTIGERLQRNYKKSNSGMTDLEKRKKIRKEYFQQTSMRNDTPFFLGVLAAFLLPAIVILGIASSSGYLDALEAGWAGR